ncbi:MAG TPA: heavy metal transport/detoxification protein [Clostridiales bacterium]|nr:heavy metal transport/detoxification protein [Clostridiales bacterium]
MKKKVGIEGMTCDHCVKRVENALKELDGVKNVKVNLKKKTADMELEVDLSSDKIKAAVEDAGYEVTDVS